MMRFHRRRRRAVAMLLVLISLATATILTVAYLASRDNSAAIGDNVVSSAAARWAAVSGLELGVAIFQTETDWRNTHVNGKLVDDYSLNGVTIDLDVTDLETGNPPTDDSRFIRLLATAHANHVEQTASAVAEVPLPEGDPIPIDLREFAVFAGEKIVLDNHAIITRWATAPLTPLGKRVNLGTQALAASSIEVKADAALIDATVYSGPGASNSLILNASGPVVDHASLLDVIPMPDVPDTGVDPPEDDDWYPPVDRTGGYVQVWNDVRVGYALLRSGAISHWFGDITVTCNHDFKLETGGTIQVENDATLIVYDDFRLDHGYILLDDDATLTIFVGDEFDVKDSYIGEAPKPGIPFDIAGTAPYIDPTRISIFNIHPDKVHENIDPGEGVPIQKWELQGNSVVKANIYAPDVLVTEIRQQSALYGRIATQTIQVKDDAAIYYDHMLDSGNGYTNPDSCIFTVDGHIDSAFTGLASLNLPDLQVLADALGIPIVLGIDTIAPPETPVGPVPMGEATPRPLVVSYTFESFGSDLQQVELAAVDAANAE